MWPFNTKPPTMCHKRDPVRSGVDTAGSAPPLIMNMNCRTFLSFFLLPPLSRHCQGFPRSFTSQFPSPLMGPPAADGPFTHWAVESRELDERDWLAACRAAPHLGYELAYQGLSTLVMGPMTIPHLGITAPRPHWGVSAPLTLRPAGRKRERCRRVSWEWTLISQ